MTAGMCAAARAGDTPEVERLLEGRFAGTQTSRRLERLGLQVRGLLASHAARHKAEPEAVPEHMTLEVLANEYRRQHGAALRPLDYGFTALTPLLETLHSTCTLVFPGIGVTEVAPALRHNSAAYNIAGGVPDARLSVPVDSSDSRGRTSRWWAVRVIHGLRSD